MTPMFLDQQDVALGPKGFPELPLRGSNIDSENSNIVFPSKLTMRPAGRVSSPRLTRCRGRERRRGRLRRFRSLDTDKAAGPVLVVDASALERGPLLHGAIRNGLSAAACWGWWPLRLRLAGAAVHDG